MRAFRLTPTVPLLLSACGDPIEINDLTKTAPATFDVRPGVEIVTVTNADPGVPLTLYDPEGLALVTIVTDEFGQAHFAYVPKEHIVLESGQGSKIPVSDGTTVRPGDGYVIQNDALSPPEVTELFRVLDVHEIPDPSIYEGQDLQGIHFGIAGLGPGETEDDGFGYITMRDGVKVSVMVRFPDVGLWGEGPYPTVIEYSGYSTSRPASPEPGSRIATLLGYATVGVNMRGSGCSGGVFDVFNPAQHADGYDVVEVVARQPWVLGGKVGMVGLSYSGIAQLYVARTAPPSLAAITPLSVIGDSWQQLWPGGLYNSGFTRQWLEERARQASSGGQSWTDTRVAGGDATCEDHQILRNQNIDFESFFQQLDTYPADAGGRSLPRLVEEIEAPVYLTGAWQDEQTGPQFANMLDKFTGTSTKRFTLFNGRHPDGYSPLVLTRWWEFLELYVAKRVPRMPALVRAVAGSEFSKEFGVEGLSFEDDRFSTIADGDYDAALAQYEAEPTVRVLFESGAAGPAPGAPRGRFETTLAAWPPPNAQGRSFYFGPGGTLTGQKPAADGTDRYTHDEDAGAETFFGPKGYELLVPLWDIDWTRYAAGKSLSYVTEPFTEDVVFAGAGYAELWFASDEARVGVQVTLTEVRPDDTEYLVTSGWLDVAHRAIDEARSDEFRIEHTFEKEDVAPLVPGEFVDAKVAIPPFAHAIRAGSRLRVMVGTPGRNHGTWEFEPAAYAGTPVHRVARSSAMPSRVVLSTISGVDVAPGVPACPSLRGQPCRPYVASTNDEE